MRALLDVNALIAFLDPSNANHSKISGWVEENAESGWASCPLTENACLRVLTNPRYLRPVEPSVVLARLAATKRDGNHAFWPDDISITDAAVFDWDRLQGHQQVTDVYLLALAVAHGGRLVTFDQRIQPGMVAACAPMRLVTL